MKPDTLLSEFPSTTPEAWRREVETQLKGASFDQKMKTSTWEGLTLDPLYHEAHTASLPHLGSLPGHAPFVRGRDASGYLGRPWSVSQEIALRDPLDFNLAARYDLARGLDSLNIVLDRATRNGHDPDWADLGEVGIGGLSISSLDDLARALESIDLSRTPLFVRSGASGMPFAALLVALCRRQKRPLDQLEGCIETDPLGVMAHEASLPQSLPGAYREMAELTRWAATHAPKLQTVCVHTRSWHEGGGHAIQELGFGLATAAEYLRAMHQQGLDVDTVAPRLRFAITVGSDFFTEIAKLRAVRIIWSQLIAALGGSEKSQGLTLHVRTATYNKTVYDPYVNMLRTTVEAFAAVLGGTNSLQVGPFDEVLRTPDDFSRRIARNTQLILQKECQLDRLIDPAGGSWYVEWLTDQLARGAWDLFRKVEGMGGMEAALRTGFPQQAVADTATQRLQAVARRRSSVIGTNQYANAAESQLPGDPVGDHSGYQKRRASQVRSARTAAYNADNIRVISHLGKIAESPGPGFFDDCVSAIEAGATLGEITRAIRIKDKPGDAITPVCLHRVASSFERLRQMVEHWTQTHGARPKVFLATFGPLKQHKARADFATGFLQIAGTDVVQATPATQPAEAVQAALASGAHIVVLCSTDDTYPEIVPAFLPALKQAIPGVVTVLAGYPTDQLEAHRKSGIDHFIHIRANALETLTAILEQAGVLP
ncbi:MAG: methylmalonyl-CoA mutase family protein [Candidatus Methylacidiphilales bacterium]|nr:methylmalonyl-CoA mutase family protein [Candidatus Methylacidiphilales bacterium]